MKIRHGYDVHHLAPDRPLIIGGVRISYERDLLGHSGADVLSHAMTDSLLRAAALGGLGTWFPDTDPEWAGVDSLKLLRRVCELVGKKGYQIRNIDATVMAQAPKLRPYIAQMRECLALARGVRTDAVGVGATTEEHLGFTGEGQETVAHAVCLLKQKDRLLTHLPIAYSVNKNREVMYVDEPVILLGSITYAMRSRDILFRCGIRSYVERTPRTQNQLGCGYEVYVPDHTDQTEDILIHSDIRVLGRSERAGTV